MAEHYLHSPVGHTVEELTVVGNEEQGSLAVPEIILEPFDRFYVKVVGGLIEEKHIRR